MVVGRSRLAAVVALLAIGVGCQEYRVRNENQPVADPPGDDRDLLGDPPDNWQDCPQGLRGYYYNLTGDHPYVTDGRLGAGMDEIFADEDYAFDRYDPSLEMGEEWWPVDDGLAGDPEAFSVRWVGWLRAWDDTTLNIVLGASDDAQVVVNDEVIADASNSVALTMNFYTHSVDGGVYPFEVRYGHRSGASGMRFRITEGDASICVPDYSEE